MVQNIITLKQKILPILRKNKVIKAGIFGSYARNKQKKNSDIDIIVDMKGSLLDLSGLKIDIEEKLHQKVDLITYKSIHPLLLKRIFQEEIRIYGKR